MKLLLFFTAGVLSAGLCMAQDYQGASAVLKQMEEKSKARPVEKKADPVDELWLKIKTLRSEAGALPPAEAAKRWLALLDAYFTIPPAQLYSRRAHEDQMSLSNIIISLPPPAAWADIGSSLAKRKTSSPLMDEALRLLAAVLQGDAAKRQTALSALRLALKEDKGIEEYRRENLEEGIDRLAEALEELSGSDATRIATLEKRISLIEKGDEKAREEYGAGLETPDLVRFSGEEVATQLLTRILKLDIESFTVEGRATRKLAAELALKNINALKKPCWHLVHTLNDAPLYEALQKKFPDDRDHYRSNSAEVYLLCLIAANRADDAIALIRSFRDEAKPDIHLRIDTGNLDEMGKAGLGAEVHAFLHRLLANDPTLPYWRAYIELSARQNTAPQALQLLREALSRDKLDAAARSEMQEHYYLALLAADEREEGLRVLRELVRAGPRVGSADIESRAQEMKARWEQVGVHVTPDMLKKFAQNASGRIDGGHDKFLRLARNLASLGRLLDKPELIEEALTAAAAAVERLPVADDNREAIVPALVKLLLEYQRGPQAEKLLASHLGYLVTPDETRGGRFRPADSLALLALIYQEGGRHADAVTVLEQSPHWGTPDLAALESASAGDKPLLLVAAQALADNGRHEDARRVIRRTVQNYPARDDVYALLLKLNSGQPLEVLLDELAKRDRFQERPLIWKAQVQLDAGRLDEAEKTIRAAISIDPSDGEQGKGDRMRAYAVLAAILEKKGDAAAAKEMRGAVSAIRKSEQADDWWNVGLLSEAVRRYETALVDFSNAYCIQSRLALRYSEMGQHDMAEQHYIRAFELMPDSFGRVESHCFGCERIFGNPRAQNAADKVFTRLAGMPPVKPQVHYLVGYLREAQDRDVEAVEAYRAAVAADPDYLNAWKKLASLAEVTQMPREESEKAAMEMFRLDPAGRHSSVNLQEVRDLRRLWSVLLAAEQEVPRMESGPVFTFTASKALLNKQQTPGEGNIWDTWSYPSIFSRRNEPRVHLSQNPAVQLICSFIDNVSRF